MNIQFFYTKTAKSLIWLIRMKELKKTMFGSVQTRKLIAFYCPTFHIITLKHHYQPQKFA